MARTRKRRAQTPRRTEASARAAEPLEGEQLAGEVAVEGEPASQEGALSDDLASGRSDQLERDGLSREERIEKVERSKALRHRKKVVRRIIWALVALFLIGVVAACISFAWFRWYAFDDAQDIQGAWRVVGTEKLIEITEDTIVLTDDVAYRYTLDPQAKTITFKFGNMTGHARYRFSIDRQLLSITDGEFDMWATLGEDAPWALAAWMKQLLNDGAQLSPGQGGLVTELTRQLDAGADGADGAGDELALEGGSGADAGAGAEGAADASDSAGGEASPAQGDGEHGQDDASDNAGGASSSASSSSGMRDVDALDISDVSAHG